MFSEISKGQCFVGGALKKKMNIYHNSIVIEYCNCSFKCESNFQIVCAFRYELEQFRIISIDIHIDLHFSLYLKKGQEKQT